MFLMASLFLLLCIFGLAWVSSNPGPNYGALGLVLVAGSGCGFLACVGSSFLPLILFLVYLGGMVVVFAYSTAFTTSFEQDGLEDYPSGGTFGSYLCGFVIFLIMEEKELKAEEAWVVGEDLYGVSSMQESAVSVVYLYSEGGGFLVVASLALLVVLFVVLMVVRGKTKGALRAV